MAWPAVRSFALNEFWGDALQLSVPMGRCESSTPSARVQSPPVPELPDLDVVADALHAALAGRRLTGARALAPLAVRGTPAELEALVGQGVARVARAGKFLDLDLDRGSRRRQPHAHRSLPAGRAGREGAVRHRRRARVRPAVAAVRPPMPPPGPHGAAWLPADDAPVIVRYRDPTQMGKVYLLPGRRRAAGPGSRPGARWAPTPSIPT